MSNHIWQFMHSDAVYIARAVVGLAAFAFFMFVIYPRKMRK